MGPGKHTVGALGAEPRTEADWAGLVQRIKGWGRELGFAAVGIADLEVSEAAKRLREWLAEGRHGEMQYLERGEGLRADPGGLVPGAVRAIVARMDYLPRAEGPGWIEREQSRISDRRAAVVSIYARGRDYHKVLRRRLQQLAERIDAVAAPWAYRAFTDSAPLLEVELARKAGLGWRGKHTLLLTREAGSTFFIGEILTDLPLPVDTAVSDHCGSCTRCIDVCPTRAITGPYQLDARRCISYLTIEHRGPIPVELRPLVGNRVYGCDDCQIVCPWNRFARRSELPDFDPRNGLDAANLVELFSWSEDDFESRHNGSAIRRIGYECWLRNLAVGLGNAPTSVEVVAALRSRADHPSALVQEHVQWALGRHNHALDAGLI